MKLSLGISLQFGSWGGGNQAMSVLVKYLQKRGIQVSFDLREADVDLIMLTEPRAHLQSSAYSDKDIVKYLLRRNRKAIVVHRVNECDERKGTTGVNRRLRSANLCADHTIFVSTWLKDLHLSQGFKCKSFSVILNGSDHTVFHSKGYRRWDKKGPMKLITHHWGGHWMKGFDIYERLDKLLQTEPFKHAISFTYIGNLPRGFQFKNANYVEPVYGVQLASLIRQHHVYVTASQNEPGANHQNEGANCGLPLLYRESGCLPEYCDGFGIAFTEENFEEKLREMMATYDYWVDRMKDYCHMAGQMCENYYNLFMELLQQREEILKRRRWWHKLACLFKNYF
jgi:hypothetical protein